jgi:homoserine dehydrogenase
MAKTTELRENYAIDWRVMGLATRRMGWLVSRDGFDPAALLSKQHESMISATGLDDWLTQAKPDVVFETTSLNPESGQPAIDYLRASLLAGAHTITANKAPIVFAYDELNSLAIEKARCFYFESTALDSAPVFSLFRETLPVSRVRGFHGIFNSTTSVIIETMEAGRMFEEGVKTAQQLGIAETDPSHDVDGWDATMKVCAISRVILQKPLLPDEVYRRGIRELSPAVLQNARTEGKPYKLIARVRVNEDGAVTASVKPEQIASSDPMGAVRGTSLAIHFELDMIPGLTIVSHRPNLQSTAYGLLADFINAVRR